MRLRATPLHMRASINVVLIFVAAFLFFPRWAAAVDEDLQSWTLLTASGPSGISEQLRWYGELQPRLGKDIQHIERLILRTALSYKIDGHWTAWLGYGWTPTFLNAAYLTAFNHEHRIWTQLQREGHSDDSSDILRLRLEQRFIGDIPEVAHRFRFLYRLSSIEPLAFGQRFTAYDELFLNLNDTSGPRTFFDRNRVFAGPYWMLDVLRWELGYLWELSERYRQENRVIHAIVTSFSVSF